MQRAGDWHKDDKTGIVEHPNSKQDWDNKFQAKGNAFMVLVAVEALFCITCYICGTRSLAADNEQEVKDREVRLKQYERL